MVNNDYDPESSIQDADIEMADLEDAGNRAAALQKRGICSHGWYQGKPDDSIVCRDCGTAFPNAQAHEDARADMLD